MGRYIQIPQLRIADMVLVLRTRPYRSKAVVDISPAYQLMLTCGLISLTFLTRQFLHAACARSLDKSTLSFSLVWTVDGRFFLIGIDMNLDGGGEKPSILIRYVVSNKAKVGSTIHEG